ncbi:class I SAM-dependent methyltransferase [Rhodanobacter sp. DHG33]|uniref:class I SAM-dependent methyltransferase n=1 Tax=Rhodanobacter sp. DHG33 TaxID=2775921 RepID=UPI00177FF970|nr:class I SAM-dependent methyltransferase [Rhodanobacter sp. DHG33]MBD8899465.1 methyltransferase domain-containing protein [Rhodanobacter sp. DHG33]
MEHQGAVVQQFGSQAQAYLTSSVHAQGRDLVQLAELAARVAGGATALDLGCGAGHASFAMAPHAAEVVAYDLSREMLDVVSQAAAARGLASVRVQHGSAEKLPFADGSFAFVASRYSAHHWGDPAAALREAARVLAPGGTLCLIDVVGPQGPHAALLDSHLQAVELLRDTSHVRDYGRAEWRAMLADAGFDLQDEHDWRLDIGFASWLARMRTPPVLEAAIRQLFAHAPDEVRAYYQIDPATLDFRLESAMFVARRSD